MNQLLTKILTRVRNTAGSILEAKSGPAFLINRRLLKMAAKMPRRTPGEFSFPFGTVSFVDAMSLQGQYREIFIDRIYEFSGDGQSPRILDCGGNIGMSVIWFKQRYPRSRITVFEADPRIADVLHRNVARLDGVEVIRGAVWTEAGFVRFEPDSADGGRVSGSEQSKPVPAVSLADAIVEDIDFLKMDIEGAEYAVLADLHEKGKLDRVKRIACEIHGRKDDGAGLGRLFSALGRAGFQLTIAWGGASPAIVGAPEPTPFPAVVDGKFLLHLYAWKTP